MSVFDYKLNRRQQLVKKGEMIDNNIDFSGRTNTDFTNKFVAKMRDTNNLYTENHLDSLMIKRQRLSEKICSHRQMTGGSLMIPVNKLDQMLS